MSNVHPFRRYRYTPLSDLWRRQLSGSLDWRLAISQSELPDEIQSLIRQVVTKSRLMRSEKAAVAHELIAHFEDGKRSGQSYAKLLSEFGDPAVTALLIRRSKLRNRPMFMKIAQSVGVGVGLLAATYLGMTLFFYSGSPNPSIDYVVQWNQPVAETPDADKAWPIYRPLWTKYGFSEGGKFAIKDITYWEEGDDYGRLIRPTDPGWQAAVDALAQYDDLMEAFRIGAKLPSLGIEVQSDPAKYSAEDFAAIFPARDQGDFDNTWGIADWDDETERLMKGSVVSILLAHVQVLRKAARMFCVDTRIAVENNDSERAAEDIETIIGLANQAAEGNCLVCGLVGFAIANMAFDELEEVLERDPAFFSEDQLAQIQDRVQAINARHWIHLQGERVFMHDLIQRVYTDDGNGNGRMTPEGVKVMSAMARMWVIPNDNDDYGFGHVLNVAQPVVAPASMLLCASRKEITEKANELMDQLETDFDKPFWQADHPDIEKFLDNNSIKYALLSTLFPAFQSVRNAMDRATGRQEGVIAALAIHRYYLANGQWPTEYDQVAPEFVNEFPIDEVNGALLKFKCDDGALIVYSVGNDRDDDGGTDRLQVNGQPVDRHQFIFAQQPDSRTIMDGDWIVWPQRDEYGNAHCR